MYIALDFLDFVNKYPNKIEFEFNSIYPNFMEIFNFDFVDLNHFEFTILNLIMNF
jgi:hypothetical protein